MLIQRIDEQLIALQEVDVFLCELLRQIPATADTTGHPAAEERIFSSPTHGQNPDLDEEWKEFVVPELRERFQSAIDTVRDDLAGFPEPGQGDEYSLVFPVAHLEAWIHSLNQARLALAARYEITEDDMEQIPMSGDARALALFQIHFYGYLQERFLAELAN